MLYDTVAKTLYFWFTLEHRWILCSCEITTNYALELVKLSDIPKCISSYRLTQTLLDQSFDRGTHLQF